METLMYPTPTKARKEHRCDFCNEKIRINEIYKRSVHVYDDIYTWKSHQHCHDLANRLDMYHDTMGEGLTTETFMTFVDEYYREIIMGKIPKELCVGIKAIIRELPYVNFKRKLFTVINHYKKIDRDKELMLQQDVKI